MTTPGRFIGSRDIFDRERAAAINRKGLGDHQESNLVDASFPTAGQEVTISFTNPYSQDPIPIGHTFIIVSGDRRAKIRKGPTTWTASNAYFVADTSGVRADIRLQFSFGGI